MTARTPKGESDDPTSPESVTFAVAGIAAGTFVALVVLPHVVPAILAALSSPQPKAWWYLSRVTGLVSYALLSMSMVLGLLLSTRFAKTWPGSAAAFSLHEHASILGLAFAVLHAIVLLGDRHTPFTVLELVLPFGATYRPLAVGMGQIALYGTMLVAGSFYVRTRIGPRSWRALHFVTFAVFALATVHAIAAGSDRVLVIGEIAFAAAVVFLAIHRGVARIFGESRW